MPINADSENASGGSGKAIDLAKVNNGVADVERQITSTGDPINWDKVQRVDADGAQVKILDGSDLTLGTKADTAATDTTSSWTAISLLKGILAALKGTLAVSGTFWQATQPVSGTFWQAKQPVSLADGDDTTQGAKADAANTATDTTAITAMSVWKQISKSAQAIATSVAGTLTATVSGTVTSNAGTNLNTSALALESGGNLAGAKTDLDTLAGAVSSSKVAIKSADGDQATIGAKADAASTATDVTAISAMSVWKQISKSVQAIATSVAGTLTATVSGTVTANAGTNLNTSALALESGGNLAGAKTDLDTLAGAVSGSKVGSVLNASATATGASFSYQSALTNTKAVIKASAGNLYGFRIYNPNTSIEYIQIWNKLTGSVTVGTTAPDDVIPVPAGGFIEDMFPAPLSYGTGIIIAATTSASNATAPSSTLVVTVFYS